jgi:hypothetical protein
MKKGIFLFLLLLLILSCKTKKHYYDIDGPLFEFYTFIDNKIVFQYNEPISNIKFILEDINDNNEYEIKNIFPVANIRIPSDFFNIKKNTRLKIQAIDTSGNYSTSLIQSPVINNNPVLLQINEISIKYTKKRKQRIILKALSPGNTSGYNLVLFIRNKKMIIPFKNEDLKKGEKLEITIDSSKDNYKENYQLSFYEKKKKLVLKYRLSQIYSLFYILDYKNEIIDYFYYYNLKTKEMEYYKKNKNFIYMRNDLLSFHIDPILFDISKTTSKKTAIKKGNIFIIKK